jgi:nucleoside-diphosphate-sugar epimerase
MVTDAAGHIGSAVCPLAEYYPNQVLAIDLTYDATNNFLAGDLRSKDEVLRPFEAYPTRAVITRRYLCAHWHDAVS